MNVKRAAPHMSATEDIKKIEEIIEIIFKDLKAGEGKHKVSDLLKAIELKRKLAPTDDREKRFWTMIDGIRHQALKHKKPINASGKSLTAKGSDDTQHAK